MALKEVVFFELIEHELPGLKFYKTNLVKCLPLDENNKCYSSVKALENK